VTKTEVILSVRRKRRDLCPELVAQACVERRERLVEQQHRWFRRKRAGERDTLALPSRELVDTPPGELTDAHHLEQAGDAARGLLARHASHLEPVAHISRDVHVRKQRVGLEHHADVATLDRKPRHIALVEQHPPARVWLGEAGDDPQRGGLAATGGTEERERLSRSDREIGRPQGAGAIGEGAGAGEERNGDTHRRPIPAARSAAAWSATSNGTISMRNTSV